MAVLIVMSAAIMLLVYFITRQSMAREVESRYESVILHANEKIRGVLSDVYVAAINNINDIESDLDDPDKLQIHLERMVNQHVYVELQSREIDALRNAFNDMQASLVMAVARSMFRSASMQYTSPKQIVESINRSVCQSNDSYMFVTLFMGVLILAIVKLLGGKIWLDPDYTEGSRFIFDVPKK